MLDPEAPHMLKYVMNLFRSCQLTLLVVLLSPAFSCRSARQGVGDGGVVEITLWSMWSGQEEHNLERVLRLYEQTHPGVRIRNLGAVSDDTKTIRALVAGAPPDFFTLSNPAYLGALAHNHAIRPLDTLLQHSTVREADFVPASLRLCRYDGKLYGLPFLIDDAALLWNKQAFTASGLDPEKPPRTMEALAEAAVRLTTRDAGGRITRLGLRPPSDLLLLFFLFGGRLSDPATGRITADDPGNIAGLTWYRDLVTRLGGIEKINAFTSGFGANQGANNPFYTDKVAMVIDGEWNPYWISRYAPQLQYAVAPLPPPAAQPARVRTTMLGGNVFCIPADSKHPEEAGKFLIWMESLAAQTQFAHDMNNVPNMKAALQAPSLRTGSAFRRQYGLFCDLADSPNAAYFPAMPAASLYMSEINNAVDKVLYGEMQPAQALAQVRIRVQKEQDGQKEQEGLNNR